MQQIIKQSILLEEHLTNKNKRCRDCITKHFLHIIGLAEEAEMLATKNINKYPLINESVILYNELFKIWIKNKHLNNSYFSSLTKIEQTTLINKENEIYKYLNNNTPLRYNIINSNLNNF